MWKITKLTEALPCGLGFKAQLFCFLLCLAYWRWIRGATHVLGKRFASKQYQNKRFFCFVLSFICYLFLARFAQLFRLDLNSLSSLGRPRIFSPPACTTRLSANPPCKECMGSAVSSCPVLWAQSLLVGVITPPTLRHQLCMKTLALCIQEKPAQLCCGCSSRWARDRLWNCWALFYHNELQRWNKAGSLLDRKGADTWTLTTLPLLSPSFALCLLLL